MRPSSKASREAAASSTPSDGSQPPLGTDPIRMGDFDGWLWFGLNLKFREQRWRKRDIENQNGQYVFLETWIMMRVRFIMRRTAKSAQGLMGQGGAELRWH